MLESVSQFLNYQEDRYCFLFFAVDNDGTQKKESADESEYPGE